MEDQVISFEVAKIAKEKGFQEKTSKAYMCRSAEHQHHSYKGVLTDNILACDIPASTQSFLQRWLREKHEIFIDISTGSKEEFGVIFGFAEEPEWIRENNGEGEVIFYKTYEDALEAGLFESLKLIK